MSMSEKQYGFYCGKADKKWFRVDVEDGGSPGRIWYKTETQEEAIKRVTEMLPQVQIVNVQQVNELDVQQVIVRLVNSSKRGRYERSRLGVMRLLRRANNGHRLYGSNTSEANRVLNSYSPNSQ